MLECIASTQIGENGKPLKYWDEKTNDWSYLEQGMNFDLDSDSLSHSTNEISFEIRKKNLSILIIQEF